MTVCNHVRMRQGGASQADECCVAAARYTHDLAARTRVLDHVGMSMPALLHRPVLVTARLDLHELRADDAAFMLALLNDPAFIEHIGDRGVRTLDDARAYVQAGPVASYAEHGFGLYRVEERATRASVGLCGLLRRPTLDDVDIGFAFLPAFRSRGFAREAAQAVLGHAHAVLGLRRIVAIVAPGNAASARLLEHLGFRFERRLAHGDSGEELQLFAWNA